MHLPLKRLAIIGTATLSLTLVSATPSGASFSVPVSGSATPTGTTSISIRDEGGNVLIDGTGTHAWTGSLEGTSTINVHFVIHPDGQVTYQGLITFTGSTPCGTGTVQFEAEGNGPVPGPLAGKLTTIDQGGSTVSMHANLNNVLFLVPPAGAVGTYAGDVSCG